MVGILIQMKLVVLRNSMTGERAAGMIFGGLGGLILAAITLFLSIALSAPPSVMVDVLALVYAMWLLGWILGPVLVGGQSVLRPDHFSLLPIPRFRLAIGMLGAAFLGIGTAATLLAFISLVVFALHLGVGPTLIAIPAMVLQLLFVLLLSRIAVSLFSAITQSRIGGAVAGILLAALLIVLQGQWVVIIAVIESDVLNTGLPPIISVLVRVLPSSWGLVAVDAASQSNWLLALVALLGLVAVIALLFIGWSHLLTLPGAARAIIRGSRGNATQAPQSMFSGRTVGSIIKEVRTWLRDPSRTTKIVLPLTWALIWCLLPLTFNSTLLLPFVGPAIALMALTSSANIYSEDGTALWLILLTPGAARHDVRGKQWAWLIIFAPITLGTALLFMAISGEQWAWPWVLASVPALLGGGMGLLVMTSVLALAPGPDPRQGRANPLDQGNTGGQAIYLFFLGLFPALPAIAVVLFGTLEQNDVLRWAGVPVGICTGVLLAWWGGRIAYQRLEVRGPELLSLMRSGKSLKTKRDESQVAEKVQPTFLNTMPRWKSIFFLMICPTLGSIVLVAQGIAPLIIKLSGSTTRVWFLSLYLPTDWQWPGIIFMLLLGSGMLGAMVPLYLTHKKVWQQFQVQQGKTGLSA